MRILILLLLAMTITTQNTKDSYADNRFTDDQAVRAIIGEAANQGSRGMLAVACAIRNRGTLRGVYGLHAHHIDKQPKYIFDQARKAWEQSASIDITNGATHWENTKAFGTPSWVKKMTLCFKYRDHRFYR